MRSFQQPDMQILTDKFNTGEAPFDFDCNVLSSQYRLYVNDTTLHFQYELCGKNSGVNCMWKMNSAVGKTSTVVIVHFPNISHMRTGI